MHKILTHKASVSTSLQSYITE